MVAPFLPTICGSLAAVITRRKEWQFDDARRARRAAHDKRDRGLRRGMRRRDIAEGTGPADGRAETARGDLADRLAAVGDRGMVAGRRAAVGQDADALARRAMRELVPQNRRAGKTTLDAPPLVIGPGEIRLDHRRRRIDVVAVEAETGLETQRIAGAEADRRDLVLGEGTLGPALGALS